MQRAPNKPDATGIKRFENKNCMLYKENAERKMLRTINKILDIKNTISQMIDNSQFSIQILKKKLKKANNFKHHFQRY